MLMSSSTGEADKLPSLTSAQPCFRFSLAQVQYATKDFDDEMIIGQGGFGNVYRGRIFIKETSHDVAIKRLDSNSNQGAPEFRAEIEMLSKLRHCHLVSLIGYCNENKEMILVYAYMPHGTLYHHLHKSKTPLNWVQRVKIAIDAARGLDYLHTGVGTRHGIIHRDVKSANILLDENWAAMISDFGLSKVGPTNQSSSYVDASVKGTFGYLDPEYFYTRKLTRKTDVYAFGVVLFELLSGRLAVDERNGEDHCSLVRWAQRCVKERKLDQMVDPNIRGTILPKCLRQFAQIADRCLCSVVKERPTMAEVVVSLQALLELQLRQDKLAEPSGINGFTWKIHKYLVSRTKQNIDQGGTSSPKTPANIMNHDNSINKDNNLGNMTRQHKESTANDLKCFTYDDLRRATDNFGNGTSYGKIYKGWINRTTYSPSEDTSTLAISVKRLDFYKPVHQLDLKLLTKFSHPNVVELIGYCVEGPRVFLVHKYISRDNDFHHLLHSGAVAQFRLVTKVRIALGIARGIIFLNKIQDQGSDSHLIDRRSIFLDQDCKARISNYDITKLVDGGCSQNIPDSTSRYGYLRCDPCHCRQLQRNLSGFTVVFAEVLTGKQVYDEVQFQNVDNCFALKDKTSLALIAKYCFEICNEVDSFSRILRMLRILDDYEKFIPAYESTAKTSGSCLLKPAKAELPLVEREPAYSAEFPLMERENLIDEVSRGHIFLEDDIARDRDRPAYSPVRSRLDPTEKKKKKKK